LQSKEKERTAKKEKEKHANVSYALTAFGRVFLFASQNPVCSLLSLRDTFAGGGKCRMFGEKTPSLDRGRVGVGACV